MRGHDSRCTTRRSRVPSRQVLDQLCARVRAKSLILVGWQQKIIFTSESFVDARCRQNCNADNKINGAWSCENPETLGNLKKDLGFQGWVMSDWGGEVPEPLLSCRFV